MKPLLTPLTVICILLSFGSSAFSAMPSGTIRTISDVPTIPHRVLQRSISPQFYKSLLISPIEGCVIVRGQLSGNRLTGMRVVHSELDGAYDSLALERAKALTISGYDTLDKLNKTSNVLLHLLIYQVADGTMALSFAQLDDPEGIQQQYYGCAVLAVQKSDGKWTEIKSVESLQGKGMAVRKGRNAIRDVWFFAGFGMKSR